jgi:hypothetical protein
MDASHLIALQTGLAHERERRANAKSDKERAARTVWVAGYESEIAAEKKFLGLEDITFESISDDDLLAELMS